MEDKCGSGSVAERLFSIPRSETRLMVGEKRHGTENGEKPELGRKRVKMRDLASVLRSEENKEAKDHFHSAEKENTQAFMDRLPLKLDSTDSNPIAIDLNTEIGASHDLGCGDFLAPANNLSSSRKHSKGQDLNFVPSRGFDWNLNAEEVSSSFNKNPFHPYKYLEKTRERDDWECGSTTGPLEEKDSMRVWKEMKQNGFLSSFHKGSQMKIPKPRGRKSKNDGTKKKMELAKREQVDRFARIAAPSGLLNELNPGIINHVRNSKQVHSIIEALVKSEKLENCRAKIGTKDSSDMKKCQKSLNGPGGNRFGLFNEDGDSSLIEKRFFDKTICPVYSNLDSEDDVLALKLSSSAYAATENTSSLSNEESANASGVSSLSVKAANIASQWLELLHQDVKGRLAALRHSKKRVRAVIDTELPFLMRREFSSNQESDPYVDVHQARWRSLFDQMDKALLEEEKQLESWLNQVKEIQLHCERGLQLFQNKATHGSQVSGTYENGFRPEKADSNSEREFAVKAAAASIYSTCNFLLSMENLPCF